MKIKLNGKKIPRLTKRFISHPATLYVAGGIGAYFLGRTIYRLYLTNPKVSSYIKNNILPQQKEGTV
jgi:hypothetical protein